MIAAALVALSLSGAPTCGPDLITQIPIVCEQVARVPFRRIYPVADGDAQVSARFGRRRIEKILPPRASWGCEEWYGREGLVALVSGCSGAVGVAVFAVQPGAPRIVRIEVLGAPVLL